MARANPPAESPPGRGPPTVASLGVRLRVVPSVAEADLRTLIDRYAVLCATWEGLARDTLALLGAAVHGDPAADPKSQDEVTPGLCSPAPPR